MVAEVVELRPGGYAGDIVGQLRRLADRLEKAEGHITAENVIVILGTEETHDPHVYIWGKVPDMYSALGRIHDAAQFMHDSIRDAAHASGEHDAEE